MADTCGFSEGFDSGFEICDPRPVQAPSFGRVSRPSLADPILMLRPEAAPLRTLQAAQRTYEKRLRE